MIFGMEVHVHVILHQKLLSSLSTFYFQKPNSGKEFIFSPNLTIKYTFDNYPVELPVGRMLAVGRVG